METMKVMYENFFTANAIDLVKLIERSSKRNGFMMYETKIVKGLNDEELVKLTVYYNVNAEED